MFRASGDVSGMGCGSPGGPCMAPDGDRGGHQEAVFGVPPVRFRDVFSERFLFRFTPQKKAPAG